MKKHLHVIKEIAEGSIAQELELRPGDTVLAVNGQEIEDVFDYQFLINDEYVEMLIRTADGDEEILEIEKDYDEDIGIIFESDLMDDYRSCSNKCIFCFIDQLPEGCRETMYFKDDDSRLSFLQGNYITMTNMKDEALKRLIKYRLEPVNISVHTTEPELRCMMLGNRFAGRIMDQLRMLYDGEITMNAQIVLCKNVNDGPHLERTIDDLSGFMPYLQSVSVVPVGISDHREGLYKLEPFTAEDAGAVIDCIEAFQKKIFDLSGSHFIHASDEWYILAGRPLPEEDRYDGYLQLENGVGMMRLLIEEFNTEFARVSSLCGDARYMAKRHVMIATGKLAAPFIRELAGMVNDHFPNIRIEVKAIENRFFGSRITVSGLITGRDIIAQLKGTDADVILLPVNVLRSGERVLLDDTTVEDIEIALNKPIRITAPDGADLVHAILGIDPDPAGTDEKPGSYGPYELQKQR